MKIDYSKYINRLKEKRNNSPYWQAYRRSLSSVSSDAKALNNAMQGRMDRSGGSIGALAQADQESQGELRSFSNRMHADFSEKETARTDAIDNKIEGFEIARDQQAAMEEEQARAERDAKKKGLGKAALQIGGTLLGAGIGIASGGTLAPISAALIGGSIGGGVGQMAGSFVGGSGKMALNYLNPEEFMQGFQDTVSGISSTLTLKQQRQDLSDMTRLIAGKDLSVKDMIFIQELLRSGDVVGAKAYLNGGF